MYAMEIFLSPDLVHRLATIVVALLGVLYVLLIRERSGDSTRLAVFVLIFMSGLLVSAFFELATADQLFNSGDSGISRANLIVFLVALVWGLYTVYRLRFRLHRLEERVVVTVFVAYGVVLTTLLTFSANVRIQYILPFYPIAFLAIVIVLGRKLFIARREGHLRQTRQQILMVFSAMLIFLFPASTSLDIVPVPQALEYFISTLSLLAAISLILLSILLFGDELHTVQAKLVGFLLAMYVVILSFSAISLFPTESSIREYQQQQPAKSVQFKPDGEGNIATIWTQLDWQQPRSERIAVAETVPITRVLPFRFPFYESSYDTMYVSGYGSIWFGGPERDYSLTQSGLVTNVPTIASLLAHLHSDDPQSGIVIDQSDSTVVVTWERFNDALYPEIIVSMQAVLHSDGTVELNYPSLPIRPLEYAVGITPGNSEKSVNLGFEPIIADPGSALLSTVYDKIPFRRFLSIRSIPFAWFAFLGLFLIAVFGVLFYRAGLVKPLKWLVEGVSRVEKGDLGASVDISERNEFGTLADHFNSMTESLRLYRDRMEDLVSDRTKALNETVENLQRTQAQLVQQEKMASLGELTAGIAHEIKNPLNFINNFAEVNEELAEELKADLSKYPDALATVEAVLRDIENNARVIKNHGQRADSIVRNMMAHARGDAGEKVETNVNDLVSEHVDLAYHGKRAQIPDLVVDIKRSFDENVGSVLLAPHEIGRVLLNLIGNALDAVDEKSETADGSYVPRVTVSTNRIAGSVEIRISDNGPGISSEKQKKIFQPFYTTKALGRGTGLGLSLSYDIVTQGHGGSLSVESSEGEGATFIVALPITSSHEVETG